MGAAKYGLVIPKKWCLHNAGSHYIDTPYECLVKLGTTKEKRLMIDIMAIRQSYERRELQEIRWINGQDNPADAMTKSNPNRALEKFLDTNHLQVRVEGWVKRGE